MSWDIKDLAGDVVGTIEEHAENAKESGCGAILLIPIFILGAIGFGLTLLLGGIAGWILFYLSIIKKPTLIKIFFAIIGVPGIYFFISFIITAISAIAADVPSSQQVFTYAQVLSFIFMQIVGYFMLFFVWIDLTED